MTTASDLRHIKALKLSKGWQIMERIMRSEIASSALKMSAELPASSIERQAMRSSYFAGVMTASNSFLQLPAQIELNLTNEIAQEKLASLEADLNPDASAKAEAKKD